MKPTPPDWPRISTSLYYDEAAKAIDWLCRAFGFELRLKVDGEGGQIVHSELSYGDGVIMVSESKDSMPHSRSPSQVGGGNTQNLMVYVDDVEAHWARAREAGATMVGEMKNSDYGEDYWSDRGYLCRDVGGHHWYFAQRLRNPPTRS
ncbi:MAG TPA: VOC family protein [Kofleriaceae bacterium]|jgi:uncharacterized glyoxalase superfamily protein PhnB